MLKIDRKTVNNFIQVTLIFSKVFYVNYNAAEVCTGYGKLRYTTNMKESSKTTKKPRNANV